MCFSDVYRRSSRRRRPPFITCGDIIIIDWPSFFFLFLPLTRPHHQKHSPFCAARKTSASERLVDRIHVKTQAIDRIGNRRGKKKKKNLWFLLSKIGFLIEIHNTRTRTQWYILRFLIDFTSRTFRMDLMAGGDLTYRVWRQMLSNDFQWKRNKRNPANLIWKLEKV